MDNPRRQLFGEEQEGEEEEEEEEEECVQQLRQWAAQHNVKDLLSVLLKNGFISIEVTLAIEESDLDQMGITKPGDRKRLLLAIRKGTAHATTAHNNNFNKQNEKTQDGHERHSLPSGSWFLDTSEQPLLPIPMSECKICGDSFRVTDMYTLDCPRSHRFNYDCIRQWAETKIKEGSRVRCPSCEHVMSLQEIRQLGLDEKYQKDYDNMLLRLALNGAIGCPTPSCKSYVFPAHPGKQEEVTCENCNATFCSLCQNAYHYRHTCQEMQRAIGKWIAWNDQGRSQRQQDKKKVEREVAEARAENERRNKELKDRHKELVHDENWKQAHLKRCPHCGRCIEKLEGCDAMVCGRDAHGSNVQNGCGGRFSWSAAPPYQADARALEMVEFVMPAAELNNPHGLYHCDKCGNEIVGIRFSCVNCRVFDLCEQCEEVGASQHNEGHIFTLVV